MSVTKFNRSICQTIHEDVITALQSVASKYGLSVARTGGRFTDLTYKPGIEFVATSIDGKSARQVEFENNCFVFGLKPEDFSKTFKARGGEVFKISGLALRRRKFPIRGTSLATGKEMLFTESVVSKIRPEKVRLDPIVTEFKPRGAIE